MKIQDNLNVPKQNQGASHDTHEKRCFDNAQLAQEFFEIAKNRLLNINHWKEIAGELGSEFKLLKKDGEHINRNPEMGDFVQISVPGLSNPTADGHDYVQVMEVHESQTPQPKISFTVRPCSNPKVEEDREIAHFYGLYATSTFAVQLQDNCVIASVHGRNELPQTTVEGFTEKLRNALVAVGGILGAGKIQWKLLTAGVLQEID
ncbi:MAG: hypothetical protein Q4F57_09340 [Weeksellaceae bacterium]|nr:hypothetical protein [Weeksellaceae bacterium]